MILYCLVKNGGYKYSYCIVQYLIQTYGKEKYLKWLQNSELFLNELKEIEDEFNKYIIKKIESRIKES